MSLSKADYISAIDSIIGDYPTIGPLYQSGDPRLRQHIEAIATMLHLFGQEVEVSRLEAFEKVRDATVIADMANKGVIRKSTGVVAMLRTTNTTGSPMLILRGRRFYSESGALYEATADFQFNPGVTGRIQVQQVARSEIEHTVTTPSDFYRIEVPITNDGESTLSALNVYVNDSLCTYKPSYIDQAKGDLAYIVEADLQGRSYVVFGGLNAGCVVKSGDIIRIETSHSLGSKEQPKIGSNFQFVSIDSVSDASVAWECVDVTPGQDPISMETMRQMTKYPALYDSDNAVFLGEFQLLLRKKMPNPVFLNVWNEAEMERHLAPSYQYHNTLFVSVMDNAPTSMSSNETWEAISSVAQTANEKAAVEHLKRADDSYKVTVYRAKARAIPVTIRASVPISVNASDVNAKIRAAMFAQFEHGKPAANTINHTNVVNHLRATVPELTLPGSDLFVQVSEPSKRLPFVYYGVFPSNLTTNVTNNAHTAGGWNG